MNTLELLYDELSREYYSFLKQQDFEQTIDLELPQYGRNEVALSDIIYQVVNHGTYHRGNVTAMLRQQGEKGAPTDYVIFLSRLENNLQ
ncbi:DinB family protein [Hazenella coriacea]|uniref:DinB family protein n=1 Tax=Hazenella coriacea TaxID=1179467 RepID=A0A4R3L8H4_9BACL|nr:DinB family protein [Hazenella coriacea]